MSAPLNPAKMNCAVSLSDDCLRPSFLARGLFIASFQKRPPARSTGAHLSQMDSRGARQQLLHETRLSANYRVSSSSFLAYDRSVSAMASSNSEVTRCLRSSSWRESKNNSGAGYRSEQFSWEIRSPILPPGCESQA